MRIPICPTGAPVISEDIEVSSEGDKVPGLATRQSDLVAFAISEPPPQNLNSLIHEASESNKVYRSLDSVGCV